MELIADASAVRQFLTYLDHIGVRARDLHVGYIDKKIRTSSAPMHVSARLIVELMASAAEETGRADLGLQFVEWLNPRGFGALSLLWEHCTSLAERYRLEQRYLHLENNAILFDISHEDDEVALVQNVLPVLRPRATQFLDALIALNVRTTRTMLGFTWKPARVELPGSRPVGAAYRRFFRCPVEFEAERHAVIISRKDFERPLTQGSPEMRVFLENHLTRQALDWPAEIEEQVAHLITSELSGAAPTLSRIAALLAMAPRTLQRRLGERGTDFGAILKSVRIQIANDYLSRTPPAPLAKIAYELGYSEPSAVSRFIRSEMVNHQKRAV